jgi:hypothetical protein
LGKILGSSRDARNWNGLIIKKSNIAIEVTTALTRSLDRDKREACRILVEKHLAKATWEIQTRTERQYSTQMDEAGDRR